MQDAWTRRFLSLIFSVVLATLGCGSDGPEIVPVAGKLTFEGREQPAVCRLSFLPQDSSGPMRPSGGEMDTDGTYQPVAFRGVHGLYPGKYTVLVSYYDLRSGGNPDREGDWIEHTYEPTEPLVVESGSSQASYDIVVPSG